MDDKTTAREFLSGLESSDPVPGGGGASAMAGALASALGHMVGSLTVGKEKYKDVEDEMKDLMYKARELTDCMMELVNRDAEAFEPLAQAYKMPADTEEKKMLKQMTMEKCLVGAAQIPLLIMEACGEIMDLLKEFAEKGSRMVISDAAAAAALCRGAMRGASINVFVNTAMMKDRGKAGDMEGCANEILDEYLPMADEIFDDVFAKVTERNQNG